ncbi:MAG: GDP-mannose 4,6-dehydratase, partial [Ferruginibacter sp.]
VTTSVRDFIRMAFNKVGIILSFTGEGENEKAFIETCADPLYQLPKGKQVVGIHPRYFRPTEVDLLIGDATKANTKLGWKPKYDLQMLVDEMMEAEIKFQRKESI